MAIRYNEKNIIRIFCVIFRDFRILYCGTINIIKYALKMLDVFKKLHSGCKLRKILINLRTFQRKNFNDYLESNVFFHDNGWPWNEFYFNFDKNRTDLKFSKILTS